MTFLQLKYLCEAANCGSINKAAKKLFISQSALSTAIKELEAEFGITIFRRTNKGIVFTESGRAFYHNIAPIIEHKNNIERLYAVKSIEATLTLNVSTQHYPFCVQAFTYFLETVKSERYDLRLKETDAYTVIEDVSSGKSDVGIIFISNATEHFIKKALEAHRLRFHVLHAVKPRVFLRVGHPLSGKKEIDISELLDYPYVSFDKAPGVSPHFSEEVALENFRPSGKNIYINDRQTVYSVIAHSNAFSIGSGLLPQGFHDQKVTSVALKNTSDEMQLGYLIITDKKPESPAGEFLKILAQCIANSVV